MAVLCPRSSVHGYCGYCGAVGVSEDHDMWVRPLLEGWGADLRIACGADHAPITARYRNTAIPIIIGLNCVHWSGRLQSGRTPEHALEREVAGDAIADAVRVLRDA